MAAQRRAQDVRGHERRLRRAGVRGDGAARHEPARHPPADRRGHPCPRGGRGAGRAADGARAHDAVAAPPAAPPRARAGKALPFIVKRVQWFERHSQQRGAFLFHYRWFSRILGLVVVAFALAAGLAPPFSGLDTLPALGAVFVALAIILEDAVVLGAGIVIGTGGIVLIVSIGAALAR